MKLKEIIKELKLNQTLLAKELGIPKTTFNNKLHKRRSSRFKFSELKKLKSIIKKWEEEIKNIKFVI